MRARPHASSVLVLLSFGVALAAAAADSSCLGSGEITSQAQFEAYKRRCAECGGAWTTGRHPQTGQTTEYCKLSDAAATSAATTAAPDPFQALARAATAGSNRDATKVLTEFNTQMTVDAMRKLILGDPEAAARRRAEAAHQAEQRAAQAARDQARADALLGELMDPEGGTAASAATTDASGLGLMLSDGPAPTASAAAAPRGGLATHLLGDDPVATLPRSATGVEGFTRGFEHGAGCFSQNAGATCSAAAVEQFDACLADYRSGYEKGEQQKLQRLVDAYERGVVDRQAGRRADGGALGDAVGTCRIDVIQSYQRGFAGSPP